MSASPQNKTEGFVIEGADGKPVTVPDGEYYFNTKARAKRMMKNSLPSEARRVYACLELATMGFQQELAVRMSRGRIQPLTRADIANETGLQEANVRRALELLEEEGLAKREGDNGKLIKGQIRIYSWAKPHPTRRTEGERQINLGVARDSLPQWYPKEWEALMPIIQRYKLHLKENLDEGVARDSLFKEGARVARDFEQAEKGVKQFLEQVCERLPSEAAYRKKELKETVERNGETPAAAAHVSQPMQFAAAAAPPPPPHPDTPDRDEAWLKRQGEHDQVAEEVIEQHQDLTPILQAFKPLGGLTDSKARRLLRDCGGATPEKIAMKAAELIPGIMRNRNAHNPVAILITELREFFHSPAARAQWEREREDKMAAESESNRRAEERQREIDAERTRLAALPPEDPEEERRATEERIARKLRGSS